MFLLKSDSPHYGNEGNFYRFNSPQESKPINRDNTGHRKTDSDCEEVKEASNRNESLGLTEDEIRFMAPLPTMNPLFVN